MPDDVMRVELTTPGLDRSVQQIERLAAAYDRLGDAEARIGNLTGGTGGGGGAGAGPVNARGGGRGPAATGFLTGPRQQMQQVEAQIRRAEAEKNDAARGDLLDRKMRLERSRLPQRNAAETGKRRHRGAGPAGTLRGHEFPARRPRRRRRREPDAGAGDRAVPGRAEHRAEAGRPRGRRPGVAGGAAGVGGPGGRGGTGGGWPSGPRRPARRCSRRRSGSRRRTSQAFGARLGMSGGTAGDVARPGGGRRGRGRDRLPGGAHPGGCGPRTRGRCSSSATLPPSNSPRTRTTPRSSRRRWTSSAACGGGRVSSSGRRASWGWRTCSGA